VTTALNSRDQYWHRKILDGSELFVYKGGKLKNGLNIYYLVLTYNLNLNFKNVSDICKFVRQEYIKNKYCQI
jgi:hypothetical protein